MKYAAARCVWVAHTETANEPRVTRSRVTPTAFVVWPGNHFRAATHEMMIRLGQTR